MVCNRCGNDGVLNSANGKDFYYCRTCKNEIFLEEEQKETPETNSDEWPFWGAYAPVNDPSFNWSIYPTLNKTHDWPLTGTVCTQCGITYTEYLARSTPGCYGSIKASHSDSSITTQVYTTLKGIP